MDGLAVERNPLDEGLDDEVQYLDNDGMEEWVGTNEDPEFFEPQSDEKWKKRKKKKRKKFESRFNLDPGAPNDHSTLVRPVEPHEMGEVNEYRRYMRKHYPETQIYVIQPTKRKPGALHDDAEDFEQPTPDHCAIDMEGGSESNSEDEWEESGASGLEDMDDPAQEVNLPELTYCQQAKADFKQWWREVKEAIFPRPTTPLENYEWYDSRKGWFMWRGNCKCPMRSMVKRGERPLCTPERERRFRQAWWDVRYPHLNRPAPPLLRLVRWLSARPPTREEQLEAWIKQINIERVDEAIAMGAKYREDMRYSGNICYYPNAPKHCRPGYKGKTREAGAGGKSRKNKRKVRTLQDRLDKYGWYRMMGCHWFYIFVIVLGLVSTAFVFTGYGLNTALEAVGLARNGSTVVTESGVPSHFMAMGNIHAYCSPRGDQFEAYALVTYGYRAKCTPTKCFVLARYWSHNQASQDITNAPDCYADPEFVHCLREIDRGQRGNLSLAELEEYDEIVGFGLLPSNPNNKIFYARGQKLHAADIGANFLTNNIEHNFGVAMTHFAFGEASERWAYVRNSKNLRFLRRRVENGATLPKFRTVYVTKDFPENICSLHVDDQAHWFVVVHLQNNTCVVTNIRYQGANHITASDPNLPCTPDDCNRHRVHVTTTANVVVLSLNTAMYMFANLIPVNGGREVRVTMTKFWERSVSALSINSVSIICLNPSVAGEDGWDTLVDWQKEFKQVTASYGIGTALYEYHAIRLEQHKYLARVFT